MKTINNILMAALLALLMSVPLVKFTLDDGYVLIFFLFFLANYIGLMFGIKISRPMALLVCNVLVVVALALTIGSAGQKFLVRNFPILNDVFPQIMQGKDLKNSASLSPAAIEAKSTIFQFQLKKEEDLNKEVVSLLDKGKLDEAIEKTKLIEAQHSKVNDLINPPPPVPPEPLPKPQEKEKPVPLVKNKIVEEPDFIFYEPGDYVFQGMNIDEFQGMENGEQEHYIRPPKGIQTKISIYNNGRQIELHFRNKKPCKLWAGDPFPEDMSEDFKIKAKKDKITVMLRITKK